MRLLTQQTRWLGKGPVTLALGTFDGVHRAHRALIRHACAIAKARGGCAIVDTFVQPPRQVLDPAHAPKRLQTPLARASAIAQLGPAAVVMKPFTQAFALQTPQDYVESLVACYHPSDMVVGYNYRFGCRGTGDPALLRALGKQHGFKVHVIPGLYYQGEPISSSRIRIALQAGEAALAGRLLGRPYVIRGILDKNGRLLLDNRDAAPGPGVYHVKVNHKEGCLIWGEQPRLVGEGLGFAGPVLICLCHETQIER